MGYLELACRTATLLVFLVAAVAKSRDLEGFTISVRQLAPVLDRVAGTARALAVAVVTGEFCAVAALAVPATARWGLGLALLMEAGFAAAIAVALRRPGSGSCRCFGTRGRSWSARHLVRDGLLMAVAAAGLAAAQADSGGAAGWPGRATTIAAGAFGALLVVFFDDMVEVFS